MKTRPDEPLSELNILDISAGIAGPFCSKLLGDLGANVVKVESPAGDETRYQGPFPDDTRSIEESATFFYFNTSKRSIVLDLDTDAGRQQLAKLVAYYDVVIASESIESLEKKGLGYDQFRQWNAACILTTISGFGSFGPKSGYESSHLINCAVGGWANFCGTPDREPLQAGGAITETLTGAFAATATQMAIFGRERHGHGEHIDVSAQEAVLTGAQLPTLLYEYRGLLPTRYSSIGSGAGAAFILPTEAGYIGLNALTLAQWQMLCDFLGRGDIATDPRYQDLTWTNPNEKIEEVRAAFSAALKGRTAEQLFHEAEAARVPFGLVPNMKEIFELAPHLERQFFVALDHPVAGEVRVPGIPFKSAVTAPQPYRPPLLGEHTEEVMSELGAKPEARAIKVTEHTSPLKGLRILDLSMFFAGPVAAQIAADAGADVIKVESIQRIDGWRGSATAGQPGDVPTWEASPYFNWVNRKKRDITLNLKDPRGSDVIKEMVKNADVLIENYTPRVMENFGLSYEVLRNINPGLIMLSLSGFGQETSWRDYVAFGMSTEQMSGIAHLTGYEDDEPLFTGMTGGDLFSGVMGANALLAALHHRNKTGEGQHINLSQLEACNLYIGDVMTGWSLANKDPGRTGNNHRSYAPQGVYQCSGDSWIAITCKTEAHWRALRSVIASAMDKQEVLNAYQDCSARLKHRREIDAVINAWTRSYNHIDLMNQLQGMGVPAGAVMRGPELLDDPQLKARGSFLAQDRPGLGVKHYPNQPYRFRFAEPVPDQRAPLLGEHVEEVLTGIAGLTSDQLVELVIDDVVGTVPVAAR
ncbi:MAG: CoA transferase [bacterium]|nr:CoA transferase [Gammaproteobacteria bacterium]HIL97408.1 CoA transferase [Pseudomonadales bacterium]